MQFYNINWKKSQNFDKKLPKFGQNICILVVNFNQNSKSILIEFFNPFLEKDLLKRKLIIIIVILILIISGNIWFIWYRHTNEKNKEEGENANVREKQNVDRNSFTSNAPVLDNEESLYCSLDEIR